MEVESNQSPTREFLALALILLALFLTLSTVAPIGTSSEAREAHVVQNIVSEGQWILPTRNGLLPSKPPLHHWIGASIALFTGLGASEFVARIPSAVSAALVLWLTALLGSMLAGSSENVLRQIQKQRSVGLFAMLILGTTYGFTYMATDTRVDMLCTVFIVAAFFVVARRLSGWVSRPRPLSVVIRQEDLFWFFFWCGLGVLAKGPLALVLPVLMVSALCLSCAGFVETFKLWARPAWGWIVFLCLAVPWYVAGAMVASAGGADDLLGRQLIFENLDRFIGGEAVNSQAPWFYFGSFARVAAPWSILFVFVLLSGAPKSVMNIGAPDSSGQRLRKLRSGFMWAFVFGFAFFSMASGKRHSYLLPIFPILSVYLAVRLYDWFSARSDVTRARIRKLQGIVLLVFAVILALMLGLLASVWLIDPNAQLVLPSDAKVAQRLMLARVVLKDSSLFFCSSALAGLSMVVLQLIGRERKHQFAIFVTTTIAVMAFIITFGNTLKNTLKSFPELAAQVRAVAGEGRVVVVRSKADEFFDPVLFYLGRRVEIQPPDLSPERCDPEVTILARTEYFEDFMRQGPASRRLRVMRNLRTRVDELLERPGPGIVAFRCENTREQSDESPVRIEQSREVVGA